MDQFISTAHLPEQDRFDFWRDETSKRHLKYDVERTNHDAPFQAELHAALLGEIIFGTARLSGVRGNRTAQHIAADTLDHYVLGIPAGQSIVLQDGDEHVLDENEMVLFDGTRPLSYQHADDGGGITVAIPRHCLENRLANAEVRGLRVAPINRGVGLMVRSFCHTLPGVMASCPDAGVRESLAEQLITLVSLAFQSSDEGIDRARPTVSQLRFQAIRNFIDKNLHDASLNPELIIRTMGISRSYLYKLFAQYHFSFQDYVRSRRLARVAAELRNPAREQLFITDIAMDCGFHNISHFSRSFTEQFGESPRAYRARLLAQGASLKP